MEHNVSSKKKIKNIVDEITNILNIDTQCYIETYVNVYPKENCMNDIDNNSFFGYKLGFLQDKKGITNDLIFKRGIIGAALSFYELEMSRYVQSKNPLNLKYTQYRICFSELSVAKRGKTDSHAAVRLRFSGSRLTNLCT